MHIFSVSRDQFRAAKAWFTWYIWFVANEALEYGEFKGDLSAHELKDDFMEKAVNRCHVRRLLTDAIYQLTEH